MEKLPNKNLIQQHTLEVSVNNSEKNKSEKFEKIESYINNIRNFTNKLTNFFTKAENYNTLKYIFFLHDFNKN